MPPMCQHSDPADTPPSTTPASQHLAEDVVEPVHPPDGEQVGDAAAADPDHVLGQQVAAQIGHRRHGEQAEVAHPDGAARERAVDPGHPRRVVAGGRAEIAQPRPLGCSGELEREVEDRPGRPVVGAAVPEAKPMLVARMVGAERASGLFSGGGVGGRAACAGRRARRERRWPSRPGSTGCRGGRRRRTARRRGPPGGAARAGGCRRLRARHRQRGQRLELRGGDPVRPCDLLPDLASAVGASVELATRARPSGSSGAGRRRRRRC